MTRAVARSATATAPGSATATAPGSATAGAHREPGWRRGGAAVAWLAHPVTLLALVLLAVNDHLGKPAYPGPVTGKLSDVAGLMVAPPLLATVMVLLVPRLPDRAAALAAVAATGAGFTAVQLSTAAAGVASQAWNAVAGPSRVYPDATDLLALPALAAAWWVWRLARRRPVPHRLVRLARMLVVLPAAVLAVAATSTSHPYASAVAEWDGGLVAGEINGAADYQQTPAWRLSNDAGTSWRHLEATEQQRLEAQLPAADTVRRQDCVPGDLAYCYRVVAGALQVQESRDGGATWHTSWVVTDQQRLALARHYPYVDDPVRELSSMALVVHATAGGHVVLVANGRDGFALRTADGQWRRIGFPPGGGRVPHWDDPVRTTWAPYGVLWGSAAAVLAALIVLEAVRRAGSRHRWRWLLTAPGMLLVAAGLAWLIGFNPAAEPADGFEGVMWLAIGAGPVCLGLMVWLAEPLATHALSAGQWLVLPPGAVVVGVLVATPLVALRAGHPGAVAAAVLLFGTATTILAAAVRLADHRPSRRVAAGQRGRS